MAHAKYIGQSFAYLMIFTVTGKDPEATEDTNTATGIKAESEKR